MNNKLTQFIYWYHNEFRYDPLYISMDHTKEDSPWHREETVGVHTDMVVAQYLTRGMTQVETQGGVLGAFAAAFHDVGKPPSEIEKFSEERGHYRAYHGHELVSARMWENWAVENWTLLRDRFGLTPVDIYKVGWMIEHHVPWGTKKPEKLHKFIATALWSDTVDQWKSMLLADQYGRISDPSHSRGEEAEAWINNLKKMGTSLEVTDILGNLDERKILYVFVGPPGAGKTTFRTKLIENWDASVVSMDDMRLAWYSDDYATAFRMSTEDKEFSAKVDREFNQALETSDVVVLDNTNTSVKGRRRFIVKAQQKGFYIRAVLFPSTLVQVLRRQNTRGDKNVPRDVVTNMYNGLSLPMIGEVNDVFVHDGNLPA